MSTPHHTSDEANRARDRLLQQFLGTDRRTFPEGRLGPHDDGEVAYGVAGDKERRMVIVDFGGKPITRLMLPAKDARQLIDHLTNALEAAES